jgi:TRAP-type C4-dicarboxylate transport system substrate-binding protein
MLEACRRAEQRLEQVIPEQDRSAIAEMQKRGLQVTEVAPAAAAEWRALTEKFVARMRGTVVPPDMLEMALRERDAFRQGRKSQP